MGNLGSDEFGSLTLRQELRRGLRAAVDETANLEKALPALPPRAARPHRLLAMLPSLSLATIRRDRTSPPRARDSVDEDFHTISPEGRDVHHPDCAPERTRLLNAHEVSRFDERLSSLR
jgi:hypothetical protein